MSSIQDAVAHILSEMRRNGVETSEEIRIEVRELVKAQLIEAERHAFGEAMRLYDPRPQPDPKDVTLKDIRVYQSGAFNLHYFAPGGICEVDEKGKVVPWETIRCPMCAPEGLKHSKSMCEAKYQRQRKIT